MKRKILEILKTLRLLGSINTSFFASPYGKRIRIPLLAGTGLTNEMPSEPWLHDLLHKMHGIDNGCIVDVGVNIGQTLLKVKSISRDWEYMGFEPNPVCVNYVSELVFLNKWDKVSIIPAGISSESMIQQLTLYGDVKSDASASIVQGFRGTTTSSRTMWVATFDVAAIPVLQNRDNIAVVKIDVEGAESLVLEGLQPLLRRPRPVIICEILPAYNKENRLRIRAQARVEEILNANKYRIFHIDKNPQSAFAGLKSLETIGINADIDRSDYLFLPEEKSLQYSWLIREKK